MGLEIKLNELDGTFHLLDVHSFGVIDKGSYMPNGYLLMLHIETGQIHEVKRNPFNNFEKVREFKPDGQTLRMNEKTGDVYVVKKNPFLGYQKVKEYSPS